jgi:hypothetical protein
MGWFASLLIVSKSVVSGQRTINAQNSTNSLNDPLGCHRGDVAYNTVQSGRYNRSFGGYADFISSLSIFVPGYRSLSI